MASLQVREDGEWKYVKHVPGAMIVNAGQFMSMMTGDYFKAAIHRVAAPPADQRNHTRCGVFYFVVPNGEERMATLMHSPVLQRAGVTNFEPVVTSNGYSTARIKLVGKSSIHAKAADAKNNVDEMVGGVKTTWYR